MGRTTAALARVRATGRRRAYSDEVRRVAASLWERLETREGSAPIRTSLAVAGNLFHCKHRDVPDLQRS